MLIVEPLLGTRAEVSVTAESAKTADQAERTVLAEVLRLEAIFSVFDKSSALWVYRRDGSTTVAELRTVIEAAASWQVRTNGAFHPAARSLQELWETSTRSGRVPTETELADTVDKLRTSEPVEALDLNAIAKGWIAGHAIDTVFNSDTALCPDTLLSSAFSPNDEETSGETPSAAWLSLGGDVVHRGQGLVTVGIEHPHRPYDNVAPMATVSVSNEALATSGGSRRYWTVDGRRYSKVLDPRTGHPVDQIASATVIAADGATADVLATVAVVVDPAETLPLVQAAGAECFLVANDGSVITSGDRFKPT